MYTPKSFVGGVGGRRYIIISTFCPNSVNTSDQRDLDTTLLVDKLVPNVLLHLIATHDAILAPLNRLRYRTQSRSASSPITDGGVALVAVFNGKPAANEFSLASMYGFAI